MKYFDYIFYRFARVYNTWDGDESFTASLSVGFMQGLMVCDVILFTLRFFFERDQTAQYVGIIKIVSCVILSSFMIFNFGRYRNMYPELNEKWSDEEKGTKFYKGVLVVFALCFPLVAIMIGGIYW